MEQYSQVVATDNLQPTMDGGPSQSIRFEQPEISLQREFGSGAGQLSLPLKICGLGHNFPWGGLVYTALHYPKA
jgi:hypothetical protein